MSLAGLFPSGPLSTREVRSADGQLRVEYQRFLRNGASDGLVIHVQDKAQEPLEVELSGELLRGFNIEMLQPQPLKARAAGEGVSVRMLSDNAGQAVLYLTLRSDTGSVDTQVSRPKTGASVRFSQFIHP